MQPLFIILTAIISIIGTLYVPKLVVYIKRYYNGIKHKRSETLRDMIREEIKNILIELKNQ